MLNAAEMRVWDPSVAEDVVDDVPYRGKAKNCSIEHWYLVVHLRT